MQQQWRSAHAVSGERLGLATAPLLGSHPWLLAPNHGSYRHCAQVRRCSSTATGFMSLPNSRSASRSELDQRELPLPASE